jgi:membrane-associated phospholipid phosphatase
MESFLRPALAIILFLLGAAHANIFIPVCSVSEHDYSRMGQEEILKQIEISSRHDYKCESALLHLELYQRGLILENKGKVLETIFDYLKRGRYLNNYTELLISLNEEERKVVDLEQINAGHIELYFHFITQPGTNPNSQFTFHGKNLSLFDEIEMAFKFFRLKYPQHSLNKKISKKINQIQDSRLGTILDYNEFYQDSVQDLSHHRKQFFLLAKELEKNRESSFYLRGLFDLSVSLQLSDIPADQKKKWQKGIYGLLLLESGGERVVKKLMKRFGSMSAVTPSNIFFTKIPVQEDLRDFSTEPPASFEELMGGKVHDKAVFLPLNKVSNNNAVIALAGLGAVGIIMAFDRPIMDAVRHSDSQILDRVFDVANIFGEDTGLGPLIAGTFALGLVFENNEARTAAAASIPAVILSQLVVELMKSASHRQRPDATENPYVFEGPSFPSDNTSFPSGHSAAAWSVATIFAEEFRDRYRWSPYVAYGLAALTSFARVYKERHWTSDVVLGALVGHFSAKYALRFFRRHLQDGLHNIALMPMFGSIKGVNVVITQKAWEPIKTWPIERLYQYHSQSLIGVIDINKIYQTTFR